MKATEMLHILKVQNKRLFIVWIITFIVFISLLGYVIYLLNDIGTIETTTEVEQSDAENNNFIGNNGDIINGTKDKAN
jgi:capsular polysaccharide biosynthesis protein